MKQSSDHPVGKRRFPTSYFNVGRSPNASDAIWAVSMPHLALPFFLRHEVFGSNHDILKFGNVRFYYNNNWFHDFHFCHFAIFENT